MLSDKDLMREISNARRGSDIHGLVEKIAYYLHFENPANSSTSDWFKAQVILFKWSDDEPRRDLRDRDCFGDYVTEVLNHYAFLAYNNDKYHDRSSFDYWMQAQDRLAQQVIWQSGRA